jgi:Acyl-CoA synthetases (AMP-forming)/AMP-acid ligases II
MATSVTSIDFYSDDNVILLNPRWPKPEGDSLRAVAEHAIQERDLKGHFFIATSGSTAESIGATKLVALRKEAIRNSAAAVNLHLGASEKDTWAQVLPTFHVGGLGIEARAYLSGARVAPALLNGKWDVEHFYKTLVDESVTLSALVPTQVHDLLTAGYSSPMSMRAIVVGGGAMPEDLYQRAREKGWPVLPSYGMTETCSQIATAALESLREPGYPLVPLLGHADARKNIEGFLEVSATSLFTCYARMTAKGVQTWDPKVDNWFATEDRGDVVNGAIKVLGRDQDYVKIGGEGTNMARLREILNLCVMEFAPRLVHQVTVLDVKSERLGSEIHLVSTLTPEDSEAIAAAFTQKVLPFEKPRKIHYIDEIPRSDLGKILWGELRKRLS